MKPAEMLSEIFQREISRLHAQTEPLDVADLVRLEKLVNSYRKFIPTDFPDVDPIENQSTEELLKQLEPNDHTARTDAIASSTGGVVEEGRDQLASGRDPEGDEG